MLLQAGFGAVVAHEGLHDPFARKVSPPIAPCARKSSTSPGDASRER
jgi:hypothetical protein